MIIGTPIVSPVTFDFASTFVYSSLEWWTCLLEFRQFFAHVFLIVGCICNEIHKSFTVFWQFCDCVSSVSPLHELTYRVLFLVVLFLNTCCIVLFCQFFPTSPSQNSNFRERLSGGYFCSEASPLHELLVGLEVCHVRLGQFIMCVILNAHKSPHRWRIV